jgi:glycosyltransferase involved in cell wall biosynthesis
MSNLTAKSAGELLSLEPGRPGSSKLTIVINASHGPSLINFRGRLIERMIALGHEVHVTAPDVEEVEVELQALGAIPHQVPLARTGLNPIADFEYFRAIRALLRKVRADLVVSYTIKPNIWASLAAGSLGIRSASMVTGLGYAFGEGAGLKRRLLRLGARALYRAASAANETIVFQNPDDQADFIAAGCLGQTGKARLINGSGVDLDYFSPAPLPDRPVFLMTARLLVAKGVREYAAAALHLLSRRSDARFLLAGYRDGGPDCIRAGELDDWIAGGLEYLGPLDDVRPAIRESSVFVLPSYREGTPRSVLEAMAMGRPIITTDVPGCRETVVDGSNGLLVPPRDPKALAAAMERLIDHRDLRVEMGARSLELCRSRYDVNEVNTALLGHLGLLGAPASKGRPQ